MKKLEYNISYYADLFLLAAIIESVSRWWLDLTAEFVRFPIVQHHNRVEPTIEHRVHAEVISIRCALQEPYPGKYFEFFSSLVKIDKTVGYRIWYRCVDHGEVSQEST